MRGLALLLVAVLSVAVGQLSVTKQVLGSHNGLYTIRVSYKKFAGASLITDLKIRDSLPEKLELVSGKLHLSNVVVSGYSLFLISCGVCCSHALHCSPARSISTMIMLFGLWMWSFRWLSVLRNSHCRLLFSRSSRRMALKVTSCVCVVVQTTLMRGLLLLTGTTRTAAVAMVIRGPIIPEGDVDLPYLVLLMTIVFPVREHCCFCLFVCLSFH
jgi:hypothetical protein